MSKDYNRVKWHRSISKPKHFLRNCYFFRQNSHKNSQFEETNDHQTDDSDDTIVAVVSDNGGYDSDNGGDYSIEETDHDNDEDQLLR